MPTDEHLWRDTVPPLEVLWVRTADEMAGRVMLACGCYGTATTPLADVRQLSTTGARLAGIKLVYHLMKDLSEGHAPEQQIAVLEYFTRHIDRLHEQWIGALTDLLRSDAEASR